MRANGPVRRPVLLAVAGLLGAVSVNHGSALGKVVLGLVVAVVVFQFVFGRMMSAGLRRDAPSGAALSRVRSIRIELLPSGNVVLAAGLLLWLSESVRGDRPSAVLRLSAALLGVVAAEVLVAGLRSTAVRVTVRTPLDAVVDDRRTVTIARMDSGDRAVWVRVTGFGGADGASTSERGSVGQAPISSGWTLVPGGARVDIAVFLRCRGVFESAAASVSVPGLLGLAGFRVELDVPLAAPLVVAPVRVATPEFRFPAPRPSVDGRMFSQERAESWRGLRRYVPGDPVRRVHWPASAHSGAGELFVREPDREPAAELIIAVHLGEHLSGEHLFGEHLLEQRSVWSVSFGMTKEGDPDAPEAVGPAIEEAVSRAAWLADEALRLGFSVRLITDEIGGSHVANAAEVGRRLARYECSDAPSPNGRDCPREHRGDGDIIEVTRFGIRVLGSTIRR